MQPIIRLIDRSRVVAREECPRLRLLAYDYDGTGLDTESPALPLLSGIAIHAAHARLLAGEDLEAVIADIICGYKAEIGLKGLLGLDVTTDIILEQAALLEGMLRVWNLVRLPALLEEYAVESIEKSFDWTLSPGLVQRLRFDAVLRRHSDRLLFILDFKTVGYVSELWMDKFEHDHQTCLYLQALVETTNQSVGGILYEGLVKGQFKKETAQSSPWLGQKIQQSPYTVGYRLAGGELGNVYQTAYTNRKGYGRIRPYQEMTMANWVENVMGPEGGLQNLFVVMPPILPPARELLRMKAQVIREETVYHDQLERYRHLVATDAPLAPAFLDTFAPLRTGRCFKFGADHKCKFLDICFNADADPLNDGGFVRRVPHHDSELKLVA